MVMTPSPTSHDSTVAALRALLLAGDRFRRAMADHFELGVSETIILSHLSDASGHLTPRDLMRRMMLTSGTLTAIIDRLASKGYVTRTVNPNDRRSVLITLKPTGRRALSYAQRRMERAIDGAFAPQPVPPDIADQLTRLARALDQQADQAIGGQQR